MDATQALRDAGLRVTRQRIAVLSAVDGLPHASAAAVLRELVAVLPDVSHQAVYDCLADLTEGGLLRRIVFDGGPMLYETRMRDNHHHFVCRSCATVVDIDCAFGTAPCLEASGAAGFVIDEAEVTYRGYCPECARERLPVPETNQPGEDQWQK